MIPILYEHDETAFTSNGLGRLTDAISCKVTEELNGIYELEMVYPVTGRHYDDLQFDRIIYATHDDTKEPEPFDIYKKTAPLNGQVTVCARHISYRLNYIILSPYDAGSCTAVFAGIESHSINTNPFTFLNTVSKTGDFEINHPVSVRALLCGTDAMAVPALYGGEYEWKKFTVYHRPRRGREGVSIELRYGKNIMDLTHDVDVSQTYGAVIPFWLSNDGAELATLPGWVVVSEGSTSDRVGLLDLSHEWDTYPEDEDLRTWAENALNEAVIPAESLTVSFFELWQTEEYEQYASLQRAYMGDQVRVIDPELNISTNLRVVKTVYDCLLDRYDSMDLGKPAEPFSTIIQRQVQEQILQVAPTKSAMQLAIEHATRLITGGLGGHLVIGTDADGNPNELLIMDTTDKQTAVNVLRLNLNGIGFSTTGYNGPFVTAWTIDSHFVADFITTGNLNADLLTVGTIRGRSGNCLFDLEGDRVYLSLDRLELKAQSSDTDYDVTIGDAALATMLQEDLFNKLTDNGAIQGIFMRNGQLYFNFSYGRGGTLKVGGNGNEYGSFSVMGYRSDLGQEQEVSHWDKDGLKIFYGPTVHGDVGLIRGYKYDSTVSDYELEGTLNLCNGVGLYGEELLSLGANGNYAFYIYGNQTVLDATQPIKIRHLSQGGAVSTLVHCLTLDSNDGETIRHEYAASSSRRYKIVGRKLTSEDVEDAYGIEVYFAKYKDGYLVEGDQREGQTMPMFVAEQMYEHLPIAVDMDKQGQCETWNHRILIPVMFQMIKDQKQTIDDLRDKVDSLEKRIAKLEALLS